MGKPDVLVTVGPGDAAAYTKPWEAGSEGLRRASPRSVAAHWAALLQDYFSLFVLRQRPLKVLAITPRGKVLGDLYATAQRQAAGAGVPMGIVMPPQPPPSPRACARWRSSSPTKPARAAATVEGLWEGTMDEGGVLAQAPGPPAGRRVPPRGHAQLHRGEREDGLAPPRESAYDKGTLRFRADIAGSPGLFSGSVATESITGTVQRGSGARAASSGSFSLKYVE